MTMVYGFCLVGCIWPRCWSAVYAYLENPEMCYLRSQHALEKIGIGETLPVATPYATSPPPLKPSSVKNYSSRTYKLASHATANSLESIIILITLMLSLMFLN
ncbi:uncharacterized protein LOC133718559 [Rosa rugosa]|uniref:uncharacterized protein LOC133718559 n=1 Tax=Rosa rugosa TaxID=74645 RepID=UPI002B403594|nr:uncharacterized protein LOC133718559 [Rosa rugosa]